MTGPVAGGGLPALALTSPGYIAQQQKGRRRKKMRWLSIKKSLWFVRSFSFFFFFFAPFDIPNNSVLFFLFFWLAHAIDGFLLFSGRNVAPKKFGKCVIFLVIFLDVELPTHPGPVCIHLWGWTSSRVEAMNKKQLKSRSFFIDRRRRRRENWERWMGKGGEISYNPTPPLSSFSTQYGMMTSLSWLTNLLFRWWCLDSIDENAVGGPPDLC